MYCARCGNLLQDGANFCQRCGWSAQGAPTAQSAQGPPPAQVAPAPRQVTPSGAPTGPANVQAPPSSQFPPPAQAPPQQQWGTPYPPQQMAAPYAPPPPPQQGTPIGTYLMGGLIVSVIAGLLILFAPFSGFYVGGSIYIYSWVLEGLPLLMPLGIVFMAIAYYASQGMRDPRLNTAQQLGKLRNYAVGAMVWVFIDGVIFIAIMVSYDYEWWFEAGFYGGAIGSIIAVVCFQMAVSQAAPATYPAQVAWPPQGQPQPYPQPQYAPPPPQMTAPPAMYAPQQQWPGQQQPPAPPRP